tara:strand:- start:308 stop:1525 length:1218 start_codon:yes stop_codon:yes gene_type:complete
MLQEHFKKFYDMKPYLLIEEEEWKDIMQKYEKEDVVEELAKVLHTYPAPLPEITDKQTLDSLNKLKGIKHNDVLVEKRWFPRNERKSNYHLNYKDSQFLLKRNNSGNNASNPFHVETRWKVDWTRTPSGWKTWQTVNGIKTIVRAYWTLDKVLNQVDVNTLRVATTLRKYVASQFKPAVAKAFYDHFQSKNVLDFSAGWGDRLAGFYTGETTEHYVGIDPNTLNHPNYQKQIMFYEKYSTFFEQDRKADLIESPAEDVDYSQYENYFDTVFTSPPYFNTEKYSEDDTQSWVRYKKIDDWNEKFLHTTLGKIIPTIKKNGILAINIADVFNAPINDYVEITNPMNDFIQSQGLEYLGCIGMEMTKRFNSGGAGNAKSEYFSEDLKEITEETKDVAFAEPIWIWKKN